MIINGRRWVEYDVAKFYVSGSVTLSAPGRWHELIWPGIDGIEAGYLADGDAARVAAVAACHGLPWGVHGPLYKREGKVYGIGSEGISVDIESQLRADIARAKPLGAQYLLVHFPWFRSNEGSRELIETGFADLRRIEAQTGMPIVLEPKLGVRRNPGGIALLSELGPAVLKGARLCLDLGDWWFAAEALGIPMADLTAPFLPLVDSLHVHHIDQIGELYYWTPLHPERDSRYGFLPIIQRAAGVNPNVRIVFEHTPEFAQSQAYVQEGVAWLRDAIE